MTINTSDVLFLDGTNIATLNVENIDINFALMDKIAIKASYTKKAVH